MSGQTPPAAASSAGPSTRSGAATSEILPLVDEPERLLHQAGLSQSFRSAPSVPSGAGPDDDASGSADMMLQGVEVPAPPPPADATTGSAAMSGVPVLQATEGSSRRHTMPVSVGRGYQLADATPSALPETFLRTGDSAGRSAHIAAPATVPRPRNVLPIGPVMPASAADIPAAMRALAQNVRPEQRDQFLEALQRAGFRSPDSVVIEPVPSKTTVQPTPGFSSAPANTEGLIEVPTQEPAPRLNRNDPQTATATDPSLLFPPHERSARTGPSTYAGTRSDDRRNSPSDHSQQSQDSSPPAPRSQPGAPRTSSSEGLDVISQVLSSTPFERTCTAIARTVASEIISNRETSEVITANLFGSASFIRQLKDVVTESATAVYDRLEAQRSQSRSTVSHGSQPSTHRSRSRRRSPSPHDSVFPSVSEVAGPSSVASRSQASGRKSRNKDNPDSDSDSNSSDSDVDKIYVEADISDLTPLRPTNELYTEACDFRSYRLQNINARYTAKDRKRMNRFRKDMMVQMRPHMFDGKSPIAVLNFLSEFVEACDVNEVHEGAARWLFQYFVTGTAKDLFKRAAHGGSNKSAKMVQLTTYCAVVQYFLRTYASHEVIARAHEEVSLFKQSSSMKEEEFSQQLLDRAAKCGNVYPDNVLRSYFAEGVPTAIRQSVRQFLSNHPTCDLMQLAQYAASQGDISRSHLKSDDSRRAKRNSDVAVVSTPPQTRGSRRDRGSRRSSNGGAQQSARGSGSSTTSTATRTTATPPAPASAVFAVQGPVAAPSSTMGSYSTSTSGAAPSQPSDAGASGSKQPCRICLSFDHDQHGCPLVPANQRQELAKVREENYNRLRAVGYYARNRSRSPTPGPQNRHPYSTKLGNGARQDARIGQSKN